MADYYVDFSATNDGDGTAYTHAGAPAGAGAYNTLASKTFIGGDKVWIRRVTRATDYSGDVTFAVASVLYIGWPISGDAHYATRPVGAQATWDADGGTHATFSFNLAADELNITANSIELHRLKINQKAVTSDPIAWGASVTGVKMYNCYFQNSNATGYSNTTFLAVVSGNTDFIFRGCTFDILVFSPNSTNPMFSVSGARAIIEGCTFNATTLTSNGSNNNILSVDAADCFILSCTATIGTLNGSGAAGLITFGASATGTNVVGLTGTVTTHNATGSQYTVTFGGNGVTAKNISCNFGRGVNFSAAAGNYCSILSLLQRHGNASGGVAFGATSHGNELHLTNFVFATGNTNGDVQLNGEGNTVYLRNASFQAGTPIATIGGSTNKWFSFDHNLVVGNFQQGAKGGTIISSNTYRTGGEAFSMKVQMVGVTLFSKGEMHLSRKGAETIWLALSTGARTVTIYGAYKNFTSFLAHDIWAELDWMNGSSLIVTQSSFTLNGALTSDASTWVNDTGLTGFKLVLSFTLPSDQVVPLRLFGTKYESGAYVYIDPKPTIT